MKNESDDFPQHSAGPSKKGPSKNRPKYRKLFKAAPRRQSAQEDARRAQANNAQSARDVENAESAQAEDDFGVPIPGLPLAREKWAHTGIKQLPPPGPIDWEKVFGRSAPLIVDLGCGNGRYIITSGLRRPECDHIGVDALPLVIRYATRRANQRGLHNVRMLVCGGHEFLEDYLAEQSVDELHLYHPQPFRARRDGMADKRLVTPEFLRLIHNRLKPTGKFFVQTDNLPYWHYIRRVAPEFFALREQDGPWVDDPLGRTRREIYARRHAMPVWRAVGIPRSDRSDVELRELAANLPPPHFDAGE